MNLNSIIAYGSQAPLPKQTYLTAGSFHLLYENGFLRYIRMGKNEILRMINHAVRDHNWDTIPFEFLSEEIEVYEDEFEIRYEAEAKRGADTLLKWNCRIKGTSDSKIVFEIEGTVIKDFQRNRVGFTVLHPTKDSIGRKVTLVHPDGKQSEETFPEFISPHQIFYDIQQMILPLEDGEEVRITFDGDTFETEDQRNWLDDSYKTYCTPLSLPMPVQLKKGDVIRQTITLETNSVLTNKATESGSLQFSLSEDTYSLPSLGIGQSSEERPLSAHSLDQMRKLPFDHYHVDVYLNKKGWREKLDTGVKEATELNIPLELALFFENLKEELAAFEKAIEELKPEVAILHIFNTAPFTTTDQTLEKVLPRLRARFPKAKIGAGTNAYFTHLNRERFSVKEIDHLVFSVNPQVHAVDHATMVENLNTIQHSISSTREFAEGKNVHVGPISLKMRWNPDAIGEIEPVEGGLPYNADLRQMSMFGAAWTLGMINQLIKAKADRATFFETVGVRGLMQAEHPAYLDLFPAKPGQRYPVFWLFRQILSNKTSAFRVVEASDPLSFTGLAFENGQNKTILLGSFSREEVEIMLPEEFQQGEVMILTVEDMMKFGESGEVDKTGMPARGNTLVLPPFGLAKLQLSHS
ncbi:MAG: hypothetical protein AAF388_18105 [Bacteroidota bacterium]